MATISGILIDGSGQPLPNVKIILTALKTSSKVLNQSKAIVITTSETGAYSINAQIGYYSVTALRNGFPVERVGCIKVYSDSANGTLNDFLINPNDSEISPEILAQIIEERKQAQQAATSAQTSANNAASTLANAVKKTGDTMTGDLNITKSNPLITLRNTNKNGEFAQIYYSQEFAIAITDSNIINKSRLRFLPAQERWNFENSTVTINNTPVLKQGDYGVGKLLALSNIDTFNVGNGFYFSGSSTTGNKPFSYCEVIQLGNSDTEGVQIAANLTANQIKFRTGGVGVWRNWQEFITTANSTVDSNGFYKQASPIIRLFANENIVEVEGFERSGCGLVNIEAKGVTAKRIDIGHYEIHGSLGFAKEGWYITLPEDANGNKKFFTEYETDENNVITVKTFKRKFDIEQCAIVAAEPQDITVERWIDIRLEMPIIEVDEIEPIASTLNPVII